MCRRHARECVLVHFGNRIEPIQFILVRARKDPTLLGEMLDRMSHILSIVLLELSGVKNKSKCLVGDTSNENIHW